MHEYGVIQRLLAEGARAMLRAVGDLARPICLGAREHLFSQSQLFVMRNFTAVKFGQRLDQAGDKYTELSLVIPRLNRALVLGAVRTETVAEEIDGSAVADEVRHAFVKGAGTIDIQSVVKQLVENDLAQHFLVVPQQMRQQRVVEPAKCAERGRRAN